MENLDLNKLIQTVKKIWTDNNFPITNLLPTPLIYLLIFAVAAFIGSVAAYYINPTGLLCGVLAVLIYRGSESKV